MTPLTVQDAASAWLSRMQTRRRRPIKLSSAKTFESYIAKWINPRLGAVKVSAVGVAVLRDFIRHLDEQGLSPKSQNELTSCVKSIIASVCDENEEPLYPRVWDNEKLDLPVVADQRQPCVTSAELEQAIANAPSDRDAALWILAAASGARIGELQAIRIGSILDSSSYWNCEDALLTIRASVWRSIVQTPKTRASVRQIEIARPVNDFLKRFVGTRADGGFLFGNSHPPKVSTLRLHLDEVLPSKGFHSLRRFRATVLRENGCKEEIIRYWLGHSSSSITDRYSKLAADVSIRRAEADRCGLGFALPFGPS